MAYDLYAIRLATHIYNTESQLDAPHAGLEDCLKGNLVKAPPPTADAND